MTTCARGHIDVVSYWSELTAPIPIENRALDKFRKPCRGGKLILVSNKNCNTKLFHIIRLELSDFHIHPFKKKIVFNKSFVNCDQCFSMSANAISTDADIETALSDNLVDDLQSSLWKPNMIYAVYKKRFS